jgi:sugar-phosphatase
MPAFSCRALLFDLDGTLIDSAASIQRLWRWWAARRGVALEALLDVMHGRPAVETIRLAAPHLVPEDEVEALETEEISDMHDVYVYPGALDLLARLDGAPWAIVTSGSTRVAEARLAHVHLPRPPVVVTADLIQTGKPSPEAYLLAARRLGIQPAEGIVIEDTPVGVQAGKAAGMRVIAIASTHPRGALGDADAIVANLGSLRIELSGSFILVRLVR